MAYFAEVNRPTTAVPRAEAAESDRPFVLPLRTSDFVVTVTQGCVAWLLPLG